MVPYYATLVHVHGNIDHTHLYWLCSELWHQRIDRKHTNAMYKAYYDEGVYSLIKANLYVQTS